MEQQANEYLKEVMQEQAKVEGELRQRAWAAAAPAPAAAPLALGKGVVRFRKGMKGLAEQATDFDEEDSGEPVAAVGYRITGFWLWQTVVVPPNVYVVH